MTDLLLRVHARVMGLPEERGAATLVDGLFVGDSFPYLWIGGKEEGQVLAIIHWEALEKIAEAVHDRKQLEARRRRVRAAAKRRRSGP